MTMLIQVLTAFIGSFGFGILFNMRGPRLLFAALGGFLSWGVFLLLSFGIPSEALCYFIVAVIMTFYAELMARLLKTPASPVTIVSLVPLIPGGSLYYTMSFALESNFDHFLSKAVATLKLASALALGIIIATTIARAVLNRWWPGNRPASQLEKEVSE